IGGLADRQNHRVGFDGGAIIVVKERVETAALVEDAQAVLELDTRYPPGLVAQNANRTKAVVANYSFLITFADFDFFGPHLGSAFEGTQMHLADRLLPRCGSSNIKKRLPQNGARHVIRHVAAADDDDTAA